ncbi:MAG: homocysteine S-methyltransferase family protein [Clostridiales bacterium]|nr:homocysteine S-methyltransferase family protein [Clostridiales bacterium]
MDILDLLGKEILIFDGAMGTMLQQFGLKPGSLPELMNLTDPGAVTEIHRRYVTAGAQVVSTNTFGASALKLYPAGHSPDEVIAAAVACAQQSGASFVALDIGPLGQLLEPMGTIRFEEAYELFREQVIAGVQAGADLIIIETMSDLYEAKAAVLAAKENCFLPVFCTMTFEEDGRTFVGCDAATAAITLGGLGVDALGANCSLGPAGLIPVIADLLKYSPVPVILQPNAGLPEFINEEARYDTTPEKFAAEITEMVRTGVAVVGGCCGTNPDFIAALKRQLENFTISSHPKPVYTACTSGTGTVFFDKRTTVIGERLNPTGKVRLQEALRSGDLNYLAGEAIAQAEAGSDILDLNVGLPELDEPAVLAEVVKEIQSICPLPLQLDSADPLAIEAAARVYNGKPVINSVNGKQSVMDQIFPIAKKYGALIVCLTLDENGIPRTAEARITIAKKIRDEAAKYGIEPRDLIIDCLTLTVSAQQEQVSETLKAVEMASRELGMHTVLGVSNVSFGLPRRETLNATFLAAALGAGLSAAIINPLAPQYRETVDAFRVITGEDKSAAHYTAAYAGQAADLPVAAIPEAYIVDLIRQGRREETAAMVRILLDKMSGIEVIDGHIIPALSKVGELFEKGTIFLPQLMQAAQAAQSGFSFIRSHMIDSKQPQSIKGKILLATVHGDIHDIGKNIVRLLLENYGYEIIDLGKDVPPQVIINAIRERDIRLAGLSALMTTTITSMKNTIAAVRAAGIDCAFFVGGAVMSERYAQFVGAEYYAKDAMEGVAIARSFFSANET